MFNKLSRHYLNEDVLCILSHELRVPITNMKLAISMTRKRPLIVEESQRYLDIFEAELNREADLINDLLLLSALEISSSLLSPNDTVSIQEMLPSIIEQCRVFTQQREQTLQINIPRDLPALVCNRSVEIILEELLKNASQYTAVDGEIGLSICCESAKAATKFTVSNSAEIPAKELPHIFDRFYRVPNADHWYCGGIGLGLTLVQKLVEQLQGTISAESSRGWTIFTVSLPNQPIV